MADDGSVSLVSTCESTAEGDTNFEDCASFCSAEYKHDHCELCKCKACGMCTCSSSFEDDATREECQPWCAVEFSGDHCQRCKCKGCEFCSRGPPCFSTVAGDTQFETCDAFCSADFGASHCSMCKCRSCKFCQEGGLAQQAQLVQSGATACTPAAADDVSILDCQGFCAPEFKATHCQRCGCKGCEWCGCASGHQGDEAFETCAPWCSVAAHATHCTWCACKGCDFCAVGVPCDSFLPGDLMHESCEPFCEISSADTHCEFCKCRDCPFCQEGAGGKLTAAEAAAAAGPSCSSGLLGDATTPSCEHFCNKMGGDAHCRMCKCQACDFCVGVCASGLAGDSPYASCEPQCDEAFADQHCAYCRCQACKFCAAPHAGGGVLGLPPPDTRECTSFVAGDTSYEACQPDCGGGDDCTSCRCKACPACSDGGGGGGVGNGGGGGGGGACTSRWQDDVDVEQCEDFCRRSNSDVHCAMCKCRACSFCGDDDAKKDKDGGGASKKDDKKASKHPVASPPPAVVPKLRPSAAAEKGPPCASGIIDDTSFATCLFVCSADYAAATCLQCKCRQCDFCVVSEAAAVAAASAPPPPKCESPMRWDSPYEECQSFCDPQFSDAHCKQCKCKGCAFCSGGGDADADVDGDYCEPAFDADADTVGCASWCYRPGKTIAALDGLCAMCACRGCTICRAAAPRAAPPQPSDAAACALAPQLVLARADSKVTASVQLRAWLPGATIKLTLAEEQAKLTVTEVSEGATVEGGALPIASDHHVLTFVLGATSEPLAAGVPASSGAPAAFSFKGFVRPGYEYQPSLPVTFSCDVVLPPAPPPPPPAAPAPPPPPRPPPPRPPPPTSTCALGTAFQIETSYTSGFRAEVLVAVWLPGAVVRMDFGNGAGAGTGGGGGGGKGGGGPPAGGTMPGGHFAVSTVHNAKVSGRSGCNTQRASVCSFELASLPDDKHGFGFVAQGKPPAATSVQISCDSVKGGTSAAPPPPQSSPPPYPPLTGGGALGGGAPVGGSCLMDVEVEVTGTWQAGYRAAVRVSSWVGGARLVLSFRGEFAVQLLSIWGATLVEQQQLPARKGGGSAATFELAMRPVAQYGGFGFTARGKPFPQPLVAIDCADVDEAAVSRARAAAGVLPRDAGCVLGASFRFVQTWAAGFEAEVAVMSWRADALFTLDFATAAAATTTSVQLLDTWHAVAEDAVAGGAGGGSVVKVRLLAAAAGESPYTAFRITARSSNGAASDTGPREPTLSCAVRVHSPPPPPAPRPAVTGKKGKGGAVGGGEPAWEPPEAPAAPRVVRVSCASVTLQWAAADPNGWAVDEYRVWASRGGSPKPLLAADGLKTPSAELTGLLAATSYSFVVQARGPAGWSAMGAAGHASTEPAIRAPTLPFGSPHAATAADAETEAAAGGDYGGGAARCSSLLLRLPALRGGCAGDGWLELQARVGGADTDTDLGGWFTLVPRSTSELVRVTPQQLREAHGDAAAEGDGGTGGGNRGMALAAAAHSFRVVAHNGVGSSGTGPASEVLLPAHQYAAAVLPPTVELTSSASVLVRPGAAADGGEGCARGAYEVLVRRGPADEGGADGAALGEWGEWRTLLQTGEAGAPLPIEVGSVRCTEGCAFRVRALGASGWSGYSAPSATVRTPEAAIVHMLARSEHGVTHNGVMDHDGERIYPNGNPVRLEMLVEPPLLPPLGASGEAFVAAFAAAAGVPLPRLGLAEISSTGGFLMLDVLAENLHKYVKTDVQTYVRLLVAAAPKLNASGHTLARRFGLRQQARAPSEPSLQLWRDGSAETTESRALGITLVIIGAVCVLACCLPVVQLLLADRSRLKSGHARLAGDEEFDDDDAPASPGGRLEMDEAGDDPFIRLSRSMKM